MNQSVNSIFCDWDSKNFWKSIALEYSLVFSSHGRDEREEAMKIFFFRYQLKNWRKKHIEAIRVLRNNFRCEIACKIPSKPIISLPHNQMIWFRSIKIKRFISTRRIHVVLRIALIASIGINHFRSRNNSMKCLFIAVAASYRQLHRLIPHSIGSDSLKQHHWINATLTLETQFAINKLFE